MYAVSIEYKYERLSLVLALFKIRNICTSLRGSAKSLLFSCNLVQLASNISDQPNPAHLAVHFLSLRWRTWQDYPESLATSKITPNALFLSLSIPSELIKYLSAIFKTRINYSNLQREGVRAYTSSYEDPQGTA